jgi:hypothetical protein
MVTGHNEIREDKMPVIQEAFFIPEDIATGLATGIYRRLGGVVRYAMGPNKGQIVKHLDPIKLPAADEATGLLAKAVKVVKENKKLAVIGGIVVVVVGGGTAVYYGVKNHEPAVVKDFRRALAEYVDAIRTGTMEKAKINTLMVSLDKMKQHKNFDKFIIKLSAEDIDVLVNRIYEYTVELARNNNYDLADAELNGESNPIINLRHYLDIQKRIFDTAA